MVETSYFGPLFRIENVSGKINQCLNVLPWAMSLCTQQNWGSECKIRPNFEKNHFHFLGTTLEVEANVMEVVMPCNTG